MSIPKVDPIERDSSIHVIVHIIIVELMDW